MHARLAQALLALLVLLSMNGTSLAAWSGPAELFRGSWGSGTGQFGLRTEGGFAVVPSIEAVTADRQVIISDPVNRKQLVFDSTGTHLEEVKWDDAKARTGRATAPLSQRDREAVRLHSLKTGASAYRITIVFPERNVVVDSDRDFTFATRDAAGSLYGSNSEVVIRYDRSGNKGEMLELPRAHEELIPVPGQRAPRGAYIEYGEPVIAPNGDVYLWRKSEANYSILKWTWK